MAVASFTKGAMAGNGSLARELGEGFARERSQQQCSGGADRFGRVEGPRSQAPLGHVRGGSLGAAGTCGSKAEAVLPGF